MVISIIGLALNSILCLVMIPFDKGLALLHFGLVILFGLLITFKGGDNGTDT